MVNNSIGRMLISKCADSIRKVILVDPYSMSAFDWNKFWKQILSTRKHGKLTGKWFSKK